MRQTRVQARLQIVTSGSEEVQDTLDDFELESLTYDLYNKLPKDLTKPNPERTEEKLLKRAYILLKVLLNPSLSTLRST